MKLVDVVLPPGVQAPLERFGSPCLAPQPSHASQEVCHCRCGEQDGQEEEVVQGQGQGQGMLEVIMEQEKLTAAGTKPRLP